MEGGPQQNQSGPGEASGTTCLTPTTPTPPRLTPTPPRLTPNPTLLDSPTPTLTPTSNSPPPPLTPAPSLSASLHAPKAPPSHAPIPAPPKLTSTVSPALRTYSRPILPSPTGQRSKLPSSPTTIQPTSSPLAASSSSPCLSSSSASATSFGASSSSSSSSHGNTAVSAKTSCCLTNGNTKPVLTATSAPITPFHTPASPTSRQGPQTNPMGIPGLVRANQSPSPVRQGVSQQALLLGKGLKGSGQDQVLLRAQMLILTSAMRPVSSSATSSSASCSSSFSSSSSHPASAQLQSLTLRPPPPGTLGIPPSLRLKPPLSAPPALARPRAPLFPPLRPRPQPSATATEGPTTPNRHLSVAPPALYSPVRAVPLRPRLNPPNGYRAPPPRANPALQPAAAASAAPNPPLHKQPPLSQTGQSQKSSIAASNPMAALSRFDRTPSAARQLQIIALSSGRQGQHSASSAHAVVQSQSADPPVAEPPAAEKSVGGQPAQGRPSGGEPLPPPSCVKPPPTPKKTATTSPLPSPPSLLFSPRSPPPPPPPASATAASPPVVTGSPPRALAAQRGARRESEEQRGAREPGRKHPLTMFTEEEKKEQGGGGGGGGGGAGREREPMGERDNQREEKEKAKPLRRESSTVKEEGPVSEKEVELPRKAKEPRLEVVVVGGDERTEVTVEGEGGRRGSTEKRRKEKKEGEDATTVDQSENHGSKKLRLWFQNPETNPKTKQGPGTIQTSSPEPKPVLDLTTTPVAAPGPLLVQLPVPVAVPQLPVHTQRPLEPGRDTQPIAQEDLCESMSTQSDNQSALSSLSSQSPPTSPIITAPPPEPCPPPLCMPPARPDHLDLSLPSTEGVSQPQEGEDDPLDQSAEEEEDMGEGWMPRAWPEGRQVLTHLVEGFVIKEGLQPFPVNRSSLLVREPVNPPPEVNGTNGKEPFPVTDTLQPAEHSTDSEDEEGGGAVDDLETGPSHRDRAVLHCQFCGKRGHAHSFMRSKRFCSTSCARGFNVRLTKRLRALSAGSRSDRPRPALNRASSVPGKPLLLRLPRDLWSASRRDKSERREDEKRRKAEEEDEEDVDDDNEDDEEEEEDEDEDEEEERDDPSFSATTKPTECRAARRPRRASEPAVTTSTPTTTFKPRPSAWSVEDVTAFIHTLPGCSEVAEGFRLQEIDGQALLLLTEDHLMTSMNIKLGPALKICAHINALKNQ